MEKGEREDENDGSQNERQQDRKPYRNHRQGRSEYASRNEYASRDESTIHYYSELPHVPEHRKKKPSLEDHLERVRRIDDKKDQLKELRVAVCRLSDRKRTRSGAWRWAPSRSCRQCSTTSPRARRP